MPMRQMAAQMRSQRSGRNLSTITLQAREPDEDATVGGEDAPEVRIGCKAAAKP